MRKLKLVPFGLLLALTQGHALTVGQIDVDSFLGQPLRAEVPIFPDSDEEIETLQVRIASPGAYARSGLIYSPILEKLVIEPLRYPDGRWVIRIVSAEPIKSPVLDLLLHIGTVEGNLLRHYTLFLDPPTFAQEEAVFLPKAASPTQTASVDTSSPARERPGETAPPIPRTYRVQPGETLWPLAKRFKPQGATTRQMAIALFRHNPDAFVDHNLNLLRSGAVLKIPAPEAVLAISPEEARREFHRHVVAWREKLRQTREPLQVVRAETQAEPRLKLEVPREGEQGPTAPEEAPRTPSPQEQALLTLPLQRELEALRKELTAADEELALAVLEVEFQKLQAQERPAVEKPPVVVSRPKPAPPPSEPLIAPEEIEEVAGEAAETLASYRSYLLAGSISLLILAALLAYYRLRREQEVAAIMAEEEGPPMATEKAAETEPAETSAAEAAETEREEVVQASQPAEKVPEIDWLKDFEFDRELALDFDLTGESTAEEVVDPLTEADVYLTYFQYDKAEEIIRKALEKEPDRLDLQFKLLEIYYHKADAENFEQHAKEFAGRGMPQDTALWARVVEMGRALCPTSDFFKEAHPPSQPKVSEEESLDLAPQEETISFTPPTIDFADTTPTTEESSTPPELEKESPAASAEEPSATLTKPSEEGQLAGGREAEVKLEVAKAYLELGRRDEARSILEELYLHGDEKVRAEARRLLESLEEEPF